MKPKLKLAGATEAMGVLHFAVKNRFPGEVLAAAMGAEVDMFTWSPLSVTIL